MLVKVPVAKSPPLRGMCQIGHVLSSDRSVLQTGIIAVRTESQPSG
jgi:hypothetical protein